MYDPGLAHRGLAHRGLELPEDESAERNTAPRLILHVSLAPHPEATLRSRPESFLGGAATHHIKKWRKHQAAAAAATATAAAGGAGDAAGAVAQGFGGATCGALTGSGCAACRAWGEGGDWRTRCAWCASTRQCVPDLAAMCDGGARAHFGAAGLGAGCPARDEL